MRPFVDFFMVFGVFQGIRPAFIPGGVGHSDGRAEAVFGRRAKRRGERARLPARSILAARFLSALVGPFCRGVNAAKWFKEPDKKPFN